MRRHHDMGGEAAGPVNRSEHEYAFWEKRVDALLVLLAKKKLVRVDELRRGIEQIGPDVYDKMGYYDRWITSITNNLLEKGIITSEELGRRMAEVEARHGKEDE
ncbi:MAG: nitrile hydratase subunit beta [Gammaproteobacteria bacterium]|nr:nitrile hydratase subunit beta [Gammaproteobacteria bacterium]